MTDLLEFTINIRKSHRQLQCTLQIMYEDRVLRVLYADSRTQNASQHFVSCIHLTFLNFASHTIPQRNTERIYVRIFKYLCLHNYSELDTCSYKFFVNKMTDTIDLSSRITLYNSAQ